tara:strand:- start:3897 stop:4298 length:402 start_codon:yes stop_codon:yes gene_type:complete
METAEIIDIINEKSSLSCLVHSTEEDDQYCPYDATGLDVNIEIKSRRKKFDEWFIEFDKFATNLELANEEQKRFWYVNEYNGKIIGWDITELCRTGYDFNWSFRIMNDKTDFGTSEKIYKRVGFLKEEYGFEI